MKKWFLFLMAFIMVTPIMVNANESEESIYYTNNNGISMTEREYHNLLNLGFKDFEIQNMNLETFNENKDYDDAFLESETHRYFRTEYSNIDGSVISNQEITRYEYEHADLNCRGDGQSITTYKELTASIRYVNANAKRYRASLSWLNMPSTRSYDIIGVGFSDANIQVLSSYPSLDTTYCDSGNNCTTITSGYAYKVTADGAGASFALPTGTIISLYSTLYYNISKKTSNTITYLRMCGDYAHATSSVTANQSKKYSLGYSGLYLESSIKNYYDEMPCAEATWSGSW